MLFDHCAECRRCCFVEDGYPPLEITLTRNEKKKLGSVCIETNCPNLGPTGCSLGDAKPFSCKLYPLAYNPAAKAFYYDAECPLMPEYIRQLKNGKSDAAKHLAACRDEIAGLEKSDNRFLKNNFEIDSDYFELKRLPIAPLKKDTSE